MVPYMFTPCVHVCVCVCVCVCMCVCVFSTTKLHRYWYLFIGVHHI